MASEERTRTRAGRDGCLWGDEPQMWSQTVAITLLRA